MKQLGLDLPTWGGARKGAGRKPNGARPGVSHLRRPGVGARHPVHVTLRLRDARGYLRAAKRVRIVEEVLRAAKDRLGMRLVHYSIQGAHLHLIVEARDDRALARGMQGLSIRLARRLNALDGRRGKLFADRFHAHVLRTRAETENALRYVLGNYAHHARETIPRAFLDPCSSARWLAERPPPDAPVTAAHTFLLTQAALRLDRDATFASRS
jgi:REP element-mobilizing transposase RayT